MSAIAKFSVGEYERMIATGVFGGKNRRRLELIRGELREMSPIGSAHAKMVDRISDWSYDSTLRAEIQVRVQNPVAFLPLDTEPQPDVVWARRDYPGSHPAGVDILLLIEVADSSLEYDRGEKAELYADAGIADYWIVHLIDHTVEVHRSPANGRYADVRSFGIGDSIQPLAAPAARLNIAALFPAQG
jgi:Uma2 family endonuclease